MVRINWTSQAKNDLKSIAEYISNDSVRYARLQVFRIRNRTNILYSTDPAAFWKQLEVIRKKYKVKFRQKVNHPAE